MGSTEGSFSNKRGSETKGALPLYKASTQANMRAQGVFAVCLHRGRFTATLGIEAAHVAGNENEKAKKSRSPIIGGVLSCPMCVFG